jgi:hypothetical protein
MDDKIDILLQCRKLDLRADFADSVIDAIRKPDTTESIIDELINAPSPKFSDNFTNDTIARAKSSNANKHFWRITSIFASVAVAACAIMMTTNILPSKTIDAQFRKITAMNTEIENIAYLIAQEELLDYMKL